MKIFIILAALMAVAYADKRCHGVYIDNSYYNLEIIKEGINNLHDLIVVHNDNSIFFTYDDFNKTLNRQLAHFDTKTRKVTVIDGIRNASALAVDQFYGKLYVGGSDGIYELNDMKPQLLAVHGNIKSLYYHGYLLFVTIKGTAFKLEDGYPLRIPELNGIIVDKLVLTDDDNIFFMSDRKLYSVKQGTNTIHKYDKYEVNNIAVDGHSRTFITTTDGLYMYNRYKYVFDKKSDLQNLKAIAFYKSNEVVYAVNDLLVMLTLSSIGCFED